MNINDYVLIIAGGMGTRFWPASKAAKPKQFLDILGTGRTLLQSTYDRYSLIVPRENLIVVTTPEYQSLVIEQLPDIALENIFLEPERKNTAPCILYACYKIGQKNPNANFVIAPSDHLIMNESNFQNTIRKTLKYVTDNDSLVTIGIKPTRPSTGYGYIQYIEDENLAFKTVKTFTEKPTQEIAITFIKSGDFLWNSGIFVWSYRAFDMNVRKYMSDFYNLFQLIFEEMNTPRETQAINNVYSRLNNISIDYALLEKSSNVKVIPANFEWSDLGTWNSIYDQKEKDYLGNAVNGDYVRIYNSSNNLVVVPSNKLAIIQGLENCIVIDTQDTLMILNKDSEQEVKTFTADLKRDKLDSFL